MGLTCTHYSTPNGLRDRDNYSCPLDLAELARADLANPRIAQIAQTRNAKPRFPIKGKHLYLYNNHYFLQHGLPGLPQAPGNRAEDGLHRSGGTLLRDDGAPRRPPARGRAAPLARPDHAGARPASGGFRGGGSGVSVAAAPDGEAAAEPLGASMREPTPPSTWSRWRAPSNYTLAGIALCLLIRGRGGRRPGAYRVAPAGLALARLPAEPGESASTPSSARGWRATGPRTRSSANTTRGPGSTGSRSSQSWRDRDRLEPAFEAAPSSGCGSSPTSGVIGVWLGIGAIVLLLLTDGNSVEPPPGPMLMLPVVLLVAAAAGTLIGRSEGWAEQGHRTGCGSG